jgi:hypothetical protein
MQRVGVVFAFLHMCIVGVQEYILMNYGDNLLLLGSKVLFQPSGPAHMCNVRSTLLGETGIA